jgi:hypothetical protein
VLKHGLIFFNDRSAACFVLNRSRGGAGLVLEGDIAVPLVFDLEIDGENSRRRCVAVWRDQCRVGVSFDMDRLAQAAQHEGPLLGPGRQTAFAAFRLHPAILRPAPLTKEQSVARLLSVLRFVELANVYKAVVIERAGAVAPHVGEPGLSDEI